MEKLIPSSASASRHTALNRGALIRFLQGALIGLGAVLPGVSGGVLCVVFGVYKPIMELLSNPLPALRRHYSLLVPLILGGGFGFVVVARALGFLLERYPDPSVCLFVGLIAGMLPSLLREANSHGSEKGAGVCLGLCFAAVLALLLGLSQARGQITPNFLWYLFCGFCIALSVIAPGMSFSTLLMPLGLYTPLVAGIGRLDIGVILPAGAGALVTVVLLARAVNRLLEAHYCLAFHGIIGVVWAATVVIIPFRSFAAGPGSCLSSLLCIAIGIAAALALDRFNQRFAPPEEAESCGQN